MRRSPSYPFGLPDYLKFLFGDSKEGMLYDYTQSGVFKQDFDMTAATDPGDPVRITLDALSLDKQKVAFLNGTVGTGFSTTDKAQLDITGNFTQISYIQARTLATGSAQVLLSKYFSTGNQRSFYTYLSATGFAGIISSADGTATLLTTQSSDTLANLIGVVSGQKFILKHDYTPNDGAGNRVLALKYSLEDWSTDPDDITWIDIETVTVAGNTSIYSGTSPLEVGSFNGASASGYSGTLRVVLKDGIDGTTVFDSDPSKYSGTGSTYDDDYGNTITRNGQAFIAGDGIHKIAPSDATRQLVASIPKGGFRNFLTATATLATQNFTTEALEYTLSMKGTGSITLSGTSTDGPLTGTGADDRVSLTFTPTAGTLTLTVAGSVTEAQLELGDTVTAYQAVGAGRYDITETGVASVTCLYGAGTQYPVAFGSKNLTWNHDGTGSNAFLACIVNKGDDGALDYFYASRTGTDIGASAAINDVTTSDAILQIAASNGTSAILDISSSAEAIPRFTPFVLSAAYDVSANPDAAGYVDGTSVVSGDDTGTPSALAATYDMAFYARADGANILPHYDFGGFMINGMTEAEKSNATRYYKNLMGIS